MRDIRTVNMVAGQKIESDDVLKQIGTMSFRNMGSLSKLFLFDSGKSLIIGSGFRVEPSSGMTVKIPAGNIFQRCNNDVIGALQIEDQTVTLDAASGVARIDIIEAQIKSIVDKDDYSNIASESGGAIVFSSTAIKRDIKYYLAVQKKTSSTTPTAGTAGELTGTVAIATTIDLSVEYLLNIADGENGGYQEIDCRGAVPNATTKAEIIAAINAAIGRTMASISGNYIVLTGDGVGEASAFFLKPPVTDSSKDALTTIFGLSSGGAYKYSYRGTNEWIKLVEIDVDVATVTITDELIRNIDQKETWASESIDTQIIRPIYDELIKDWIEGKDYVVGDKVLVNNEFYICILDHTSSIFIDDLLSGSWDMINQEKLPYMDDDSYDVTKWKYIRTLLQKGMIAGKLFSTEICSTYALAYTVNNSYTGGVLDSNGDIHMMPYNAVRGQKISAAGVVSTYALAYTAAQAYRGGVLAPNGDIHMMLYNAVCGQKISAAGVVSTYALAYTTSGAYEGGVLAPNGDIHFVPYAAVVGQKISAAGVVSTYALAYTVNEAHLGGVLAPNGDIHFVPYKAVVGQKISAAGVVSTYALAYTTAGAYEGGVLAPNGDIHFIPHYAGVGQKINTLSGVPFSLALCCSPFLNKF